MHSGSFCQRLQRRQRVWWGRGEPGAPLTLAGRLHRAREWRTFRRRDDPEAAWRCCPLWPRSLINKWNGREYAARHGLALPELYWRRFPLAPLPLAGLPARFVLRSVRGFGRRTVRAVVEGRDLLLDEKVTADGLRRELRRGPRAAWTIPVLAEELIAGPDGGLPVEIKCYAFGGAVPAVQVIHRGVGERRTTRFYTPLWEPFAERVVASVEQAELEPAPPGLDAMVSATAAIGREVGTFLRVDFFVATNGPVFNEFSSVPGGGRGYSPFGDTLLGAAWSEHVPDAI